VRSGGPREGEVSFPGMTLRSYRIALPPA
jgi:hypothetical protein